MKTKFDLWLTVLAWGNSLLSVIFVSMTILISRANIPGGIVQRGYHPDPSNIVMALLFPLVGAVILTKRSRHPIGWLLFWIGLIQSVQQLATQYGIYALYTHPNPAGPRVAWVSSNIWYPSLCLYLLLLMLFPTGRRLEERWGRLIWLPVTCLFGALVFSLAIQNIIDRRFYRQRYNTNETLEKFGQSVRNEVDLDELSARLVQVVQETIQPQEMILWIKEDG